MTCNNIKNKHTVGIVVLNWKGAEDTIACIDSLMCLNDDLCDFKVVVVDNFSPDDSYELIHNHIQSNYKDLFSSCDTSDRNLTSINKISLLQSGCNLGFSGGNNIGIRYALSDKAIDFVWLLNNDTVVDKNSLFFLIKKAISDSNYGVIGSKLVYEHDRNLVQALGGKYNKFLGISKHVQANTNVKKQHLEYDIEKSIDYVVGASLFMSRTVLEEIGLLSEDYFLFYEELDYALRITGRYKLGISLESIVYHKEGAARKKEVSEVSDYYSVVNRLVLTRKFFPHLTPLIGFMLFLVILNRLRRGQFRKAKNIFLYQFFGIRSFDE